MSAILHGALGVAAWYSLDRSDRTETTLVDIEVAPPPPKAEALPAEVAKPPEDQLASAQQPESTPAPSGGEGGGDAGVPDAPIDAPIDAPVDAARPDAAKRRPDAMTVAMADARPDATADAQDDLLASGSGTGSGSGSGSGAGSNDVAVGSGSGSGSGAGSDDVAVGSGSGSGSNGIAVGSGSGSNGGVGSGVGSGSNAVAVGSGSGVPGPTDEVAVAGAPTSAGTAANLIAYFPKGNIATCMIRFDRVRGTEWAPTFERLLQPMPDYATLFGTSFANIGDKLDSLIVSTSNAGDAAATTLVSRTSLTRAALRDFLDAATPVTWSAAKGGLLGVRTASAVGINDKRVFLSPFRGWFLLAKPVDLGPLLSSAKGDLDSVEAHGKLPPWLANIRSIEAESGDKKGPAFVLTVALDGNTVDMKGKDMGLGVPTVQLPQRLSLALELVPQGFLVRGNLKFGDEAQATTFLAAFDKAKQSVLGSQPLQMLIGKPVIRVVENLSMVRSGDRVSYATSMSIADARAIFRAAALQIDQHFGKAP